MRKTLFGIFLALAVFSMLVFASAARAQGLESLPADLREDIEDLLETRWPPVVDEVEIEADEDGALAVTVKFGKINDKSEDEVSEAYLYYSADEGETWEELELEEGDDNKEWIGTLEDVESGTELMYGIRATDTSNNVYLDIVCAPGEWPPTDEYMDGSCAAEGGDACVTNLPRGCMFPMSRHDDETDIDDLNIQEYQISADDEKYYLDIAVKGKVQGGTISPMDIYAYVALAINPDKGEAETTEDLLDKGIFLLYAPQAEIAGGALPIKSCMVGWKKGQDLAVDSSNIKCKAKKNHLFIDFKKDLAFDNPSGYLSWLVATAHITNISPLSGGVGNLARVTNAKFITRTYTVE